MTTPNPGHDWDRLGESPWVEAVYRTLLEMPELAGFDDPLDVRTFVRPESMPLANLELELNARGVPATGAIGEEFTRRVGQYLYEYFDGRDKWSGVDRTAEDLDFRWVHTWILESGRRVGIEFCVTPSPLAEPTPDYVAAVRDWLAWVVPHFDGDIPSRNPAEKAVQVVFCEYGQPGFSLQAGATALITRTFSVS